jgi:hypothetical protein
MEELRKTKKNLPIILELLAKISCQFLDSNPSFVCTEPLITFEAVVITRKLLTDSTLLERRSQWPCGLRRGAACCASVLYSTLAQPAGMPP